MANGDPSELPGAEDSGDPSAAGSAAPSPSPQGGPPGGGPILAALAQQRRGPQVSAPGMGDNSASMKLISDALAMMQQALPGLQVGTPIHTASLRAVQQLSRHIGQTQSTIGQQQTHMMDLVRGLKRAAMLQQIMSQQQQQGGGQPDVSGTGGPSPIPGAMAQAPMPSTPLPGA